MKLKYAMICAAIFFATIYLQADRLDVKREIFKIKQSERGWRFLQDHSEDNLKKVILFLNDPEKYFKQVMKIDEICLYISLYDDCSLKMNENQSVMSIFLSEFFNEINITKADILSFLLLKCDAPVYLEEIADRYTKKFKDCPQRFMPILKKTEWKRIVDRLDAGDWSELKNGLEKLGNSHFEVKFKKYVLAPRDGKGNRIRDEVD